MQEIKVALEVSDPKGVVAAELGKDRVNLSNEVTGPIAELSIGVG